MKPRNHVLRDMFTNGLYRAKVVKSKKSYARKSKHKEVYDVNERLDSSHKDLPAQVSY